MLVLPASLPPGWLALVENELRALEIESLNEDLAFETTEDIDDIPPSLTLFDEDAFEESKLLLGCMISFGCKFSSAGDSPLLCCM